MLKDYLDSELLETLAEFEDEGLAVFLIIADTLMLCLFTLL